MVHRQLILALLGILAFGSARADDLLALETERYEAIEAADVERLDVLLADGLVFTHASSKLDSKDSFLAKLRDGKLVYRSIEIEDARVQNFGTSGVITGRSILTVSVNGEDRPLDLRFTTVWVRFDTGWQVVAYQSTINQEPVVSENR